MSKIAFERAFQELTEAEIAALMAAAETMTFPAGTRIMREGDENERIFVVLKGVIRVVRLEREGKEVALSHPLGPGDTFGEMSFIDRMGASATLVAAEDIEAKAVDRRVVEELAKKSLTFKERLYLSLLYTVIRRLRRLDATLLFPG